MRRVVCITLSNSIIGFTEEQIQQSPVALAARYAWDMNQSTLQDHIEKEERIAFIRTLVESVHHEMQHCDITWFRFVSARVPFLV